MLKICGGFKGSSQNVRIHPDWETFQSSAGQKFKPSNALVEDITLTYLSNIFGNTSERRLVVLSNTNDVVAQSGGRCIVVTLWVHKGCKKVLPNLFHFSIGKGTQLSARTCL